MAGFSYQLTGPIGTAATFGLIVLQTDETLEQDFRRLFPACDVAVYVSRIPSAAVLSVDSIAEMKAELPRAAMLLPPAARFDAVGYGCTSGTTLIGAEAVADLIGAHVTAACVSDPLTAAKAALRAVDAGSVGIVSPYVPSVAGPVAGAFADAGFAVPATVSFGEQVEANVARIDPASIYQAGLEVGRKPGVDAVFLSCTNLRTLDIIRQLEAALGLPVISSNQALAWHMARAAAAEPASDAPGSLFAKGR